MVLDHGNDDAFQMVVVQSMVVCMVGTFQMVLDHGNDDDDAFQMVVVQSMVVCRIFSKNAFSLGSLCSNGLFLCSNFPSFLPPLPFLLVCFLPSFRKAFSLILSFLSMPWTIWIRFRWFRLFLVLCGGGGDDDVFHCWILRCKALLLPPVRGSLHFP